MGNKNAVEEIISGLKEMKDNTFVRLEAAGDLTPKLKGVKANILIGSCAYGGFYSVTSRSDLEIVCLFDRADAEKLVSFLQNATPYFVSGEADIYKRVVSKDPFETSLIFWTTDFFERMCSDINFQFANRFSDESLEGTVTVLGSMHGWKVKFVRHSLPVKGGFSTKYPIHYIEKGFFYCMGVPVENMISNPIVLNGDDEYVERNIDSLWNILVDRARREISDEEDPFVHYCLLRYGQMHPMIQSKIKHIEFGVWNEKSMVGNPLA